jgi:hypothetical protein
MSVRGEVVIERDRAHLEGLLAMFVLGFSLEAIRTVHAMHSEWIMHGTRSDGTHSFVSWFPI